MSNFNEDKFKIFQILADNKDLMLWFEKWADTHKKVCSKCNKLKVEKSFYHVKNNTVYSSGRLPICKKCINNLFNYYCGKYDDEYKAMQKVCSLFDIYYDKRMFDTLVVDDNTVGRYIQKLNLRQNKFKKSYDDSFFG